VQHVNQYKNKIKYVMASVFMVDVTDIPTNCSYQVFERWDSLAHMNLIVALEEEFNIRFSDDDVADMLNIDLIVNIIAGRLACKR